jgi:uncharacterized Zn finger protein
MAQKQIRDAAKKGKPMSPVVLGDREVAKTFWGKAWCANLEHYADFANRIDRGLRYVRNGSVVDLQVEAGLVKARVMGSELYTLKVKVTPLPAAAWAAVKKACAGGIGSVVELLEGKLSDSVMAVVTAPGKGLFPKPNEMHFSCSCPDWAEVCKHVAAALYGVGARLDSQPELLFTLRGVDANELVSRNVGKAVAGLAKKAAGAKAPKVKHGDLGALFGIDLKGGKKEAAAKRATAGKKKPKNDGAVGKGKALKRRA